MHVLTFLVSSSLLGLEAYVYASYKFLRFFILNTLPHCIVDHIQCTLRPHCVAYHSASRVWSDHVASLATCSVQSDFFYLPRYIRSACIVFGFERVSPPWRLIDI